MYILYQGIQSGWRDNMGYKHCGCALATAVWLSIAFSGVAEAQPSDTMSVCLGRGGVTLDQRVDACSSIIASRTATNENLALAYGNRGVAKSFRKEFESARKDYLKSIRLDPSSGASHRFRGNLHMFDADERKAGEEFRKAIEIDPKLAPAYANLGHLAVRRGSAASAIEYLNKSIAVNPDDFGAYLLRGHARIQLEAYDQAIEDFIVALKWYEPADALFGRGSAFAHKREHQKALADYDEGLRLKNDRAEPFAIRCAIRAVLGQPIDEVMQDCDKAMVVSGSMDLAPSAIMLRNMRGYALLKFDKPDRAVTEFNVALNALGGLRDGNWGLLKTEGQAISLYGRGLAKRRLVEAHDSAKDFELSAKLSSRSQAAGIGFL